MLDILFPKCYNQAKSSYLSYIICYFCQIYIYPVVYIKTHKRYMKYGRHHMRTLVIASQKGGTGKTTTSAAIAHWAASHGSKTLCIDLDPQGSLTYVLQGDGNAPGCYELMKGASASELVQACQKGGPHLLAASLQLAGADAEFSSRPGRDFLLKKSLEPLRDTYNLAVIDTPPTLGTLLVNALSAADEVLIPVQADVFALQSVYQLMETIGQVREYCNPGLKVAGVLLTRYNGRAVLSRDLRESLEATCRELAAPVFATAIREGIAAKEAQTLRESLFTYAPKSNPALDYAALMGELKIGV